MQLHLIRHAAAEPDPEPLDEELDPGARPSDRARPLTTRGARRFRREVRGLRRLGVRFDRVYTSPLVRAVETAALLAPLTEATIEETELLAAPPGQALLDAIEGERVALVGHQPWLGQLLGILLVGSPDVGPAWAWRKGGVALLEGELRPDGMQLLGFWAPRVLRKAR